MDQILVCSNKIPSVTAIRNSFIQNYMLDANGSYVKVYLYLSMCIQSGRTDFSISSLADSMENTENDIIRALQHWERKNLLKIIWHESKKYITGIELLNPDDRDADTAHVPASQPGTESTASRTVAAEASAGTKKSSVPSFSITPEQMSTIAENSDFTWICQIVETYLERPVKPIEVQLLIYLFDTLHFSKDLILYLYEYCISLGKSNVKYIQTVALSWAESHVTTPEEAQALSEQYSSTHSAIAKALGLTRPLAGIERQYVKRWHDEWHMDLSVILEACNRTLLSIQRPDFKYIDGILKNWNSDNVHTLMDVAKSDEKYAKRSAGTQKATPPGNYRNSSHQKINQFQNFPQRNMPEDKMNQLERMLLSE